MEKLLIDIYIILGIYFFLGGIGIVLINRKKEDKAEKRNRWVKFWVYLGIVNTLILSIYLDYIFYVSILFLVIGLFEIISINKNGLSEKFIFPLIIYITLAFFFLKFTLIPKEIVLLVYLFVLTFDGFSQIFGQLFGKSQILKKISPNKTWEGFFGGFLAVFLTAYLYYSSQNNYQTELKHPLFVALTLSILAFIGDILASFYKRINSVKDYSKIIPQHGGVLDRFDSLIFVGASMQIFETFF
ncbi:MAG: phosphatidate cytidylyltransferase [Flavobacteriia bacterium]|jgi:phosphatidate cytidylyltransferase